MEKITKDLFYSSKENILFWVAGYTKDSQMENVKIIIEDLNQNAMAFAEKAGCNFDEVRTFYNNQPPRYQYMRVFYTLNPKNVEGAFTLGKDWTMRKWLTS